MARQPKELSCPSVVDAAGGETLRAAEPRRNGAWIRFVTIRFPNKGSRVAGVYRLMRRIRVVCLPNDNFVISQEGLSILEGEGIAHEVLEEADLDETLAAPRNSAAPLL